MNPREILRQRSYQAASEAQASAAETAVVEQVLAVNTTEAHELGKFIAQCLNREGTEPDFLVGSYQRSWLGRRKLVPSSLAGWVISEVARYYDMSNQSWSSAFGNGLLIDGRYIDYYGNSPVVTPRRIVEFTGEVIPRHPGSPEPYIYSNSGAEIYRRTGRIIDRVTNHQAEQITRTISIKDTLDVFGRRKVDPKYYR